jgi:hypothetical protein
MESLPRPVSRGSLATLIVALVDNNGTAAHPYSRDAVAGDRHSFVRNLVDFADFVHLACLLHGQTPGFIDVAANHIADNAAREWLIRSVDAFLVERTYLARLAVAAGPLPSTAGHHETTALISQQRHALEMLGQSDRKGCTLGAAAAMVLEWHAFRPILDGGAARLGIEVPVSSLPSRDATIALLDALPDPDAISRAAQFGATQFVGQQKGLWDLLQARALVRQDY